MATEPGYIEQYGSPRAQAYARGIREGGCPECGHDSLMVTQALVATRIDPECWSGYCTCAKRYAEPHPYGCLECGPTVSDIHEPCYCEMCDTEGGCGEPCDCQCHCNCGFET